jgi:pimeloyl-ACP methyl ester carboxylesterase
VLNYVNSNFSLPIILLGRSFGGSTVLAGGSGDKSIAGYILWSAPVNLHQAFSSIIPEEYQQMLNGESVKIRDEVGEFTLKPDFAQDFGHHNMDSYLEQINSRPVLVIHANDDELVAPSNALYMRERLKNCSLFLVDNAGHRFLDKTELREAITLEWIKSTFK